MSGRESVVNTTIDIRDVKLISNYLNYLLKESIKFLDLSRIIFYLEENFLLYKSNLNEFFSISSFKDEVDGIVSTSLYDQKQIKSVYNIISSESIILENFKEIVNNFKFELNEQQQYEIEKVESKLLTYESLLERSQYFYFLNNLFDSYISNKLWYKLADLVYLLFKLQKSQMFILV